MSQFDQQAPRYKVISSPDGQCSMVPAGEPTPEGWTETGQAGSADDCLAYIEGMLTGIWADVLGVPSVNASDNFFELGGRSLLGTEVIGRVRQLLQIDVPLRTLYEHPTVAGMLASIDLAAQHHRTDTPTLFARRPDADAPAPPAYSQERMWQLDRLDHERRIFSFPQLYRVTGTLDHQALERSLATIMRRQALLRARFVQGPERLELIFDPPQPDVLPLVDLADLPADEREVEANRLIHARVDSPIDLAAGPLCSFLLLRLAPSEHRLLIHLHHSITDEWSMRLFFAELSDLYEAFATGTSLELAELPVQFSDFSTWQRSWLESEAGRALLDNWRSRFAPAPPLFGSYPPAQAGPSGAGTFAVSANEVETLAHLSSAAATTLPLALLAGFIAALHAHTNQRQIAAGVSISNRSHPAIEPLIGFFANTLLLQADLTPEHSLSELLGQLREAHRDSYAYHDIPIELLMKQLGQEHVEVLFNVIPAAITSDQQARMGGLELTMLPIKGQGGYQYPTLFVIITEGPNGLRGTLLYRTDRLSADAAEALLATYRRILTAGAHQPEQPLAQLLANKD